MHDYYGGLPDLERGLVRVLHSLSFIDDPTRMLRAVRYEQRYAFTIDPRTLQLIDEARPLLARLSPERIRHELDLLFEEPRAADMLARLDQLGLIGSISELLPWSRALYERLGAGLKMPFPEGWEFSQPVGEAVYLGTDGLLELIDLFTLHVPTLARPVDASVRHTR